MYVHAVRMATISHLSSHKTFNGVSQHDDQGEEEPGSISHWIIPTVVVEKVT